MNANTATCHEEHCHEEHCITCGDQGIPMRIVSLEDDGLASCRDGAGERATVDVQLVGGVAMGDTVLVHAGVALVRLSAMDGA